MSRAKLGISERRACAVAGQHRSTQRKRPRGRDDEEALTAAIIRLGPAHLAAGGAEGPTEATETGQAVAQRRILHPSAAVLAQSRLVL